MLVRPLALGETLQTEQTSDSEFISLSDISTFVRRYLLSILVFPAAGAVLALFYVATSDPIYSARSEILIEPKLPQYLQQQQSGGVTTSLDTAQIESQIAVMRSEKISQMVIDQLSLMDNHDFFILRKVSIPERLERFARTVLGTLGYAEADWPGWLRSTLEVKQASAPDPAAGLSDFERSRIAIDIFSGNIDIRRVGVSYAVSIGFRSRNPDLAAEVANATAENFVREQIETKAAAARQGGEWLEKRMGELRDKMNMATQIAQEFRARHDYRVRPPGATLVDGQIVYDDAGDTARDGPTLEELEVTADTYRQMYESFLLAFTNNLSQQSYPVADARVITAATRPLAPSHPRKKLVLAFGLFAGLISGVGVAFLRNALDPTIRSPRQVRDQLGLRCLGELPAMGSRNGGFGAYDEVTVSPHSTYSESLKRAKFAIRREGSAEPVRSIGVTSALPDEGKGVVASNLALLYAASGQRTLLVDADTDYSPVSQKLLGRRSSGVEQFSEASRGSVVARACHQVDLLPKSALEGGASARLPDWNGYDIVVVNLPPLASGRDRLAISTQLDGVVVVAEWGRASAELTGDLVTTLRAHGAQIFGGLLTRVRIMSAKPYRPRAWTRART